MQLRRGILLDIEGTTTPISFVYDVLFPFARAHAREHMGAEEVQALHAEYENDVRNGQNPPAWSDMPVEYVHWLMDQDRKSTALKNLQGKIWLDGYRRGELHGDVFGDVPPALKRWQGRGIDVRIYSSGSILAQRLLFSTTASGDLTAFLQGYFDTTTGPKTDRESYVKIAAAYGIAAAEILFLSDVSRELDAARSAGMKTTLCVRPGNQPQPEGLHSIIHSFEEVEI